MLGELKCPRWLFAECGILGACVVHRVGGARPGLARIASRQLPALHTDAREHAGTSFRAALCRDACRFAFAALPVARFVVTVIAISHTFAIHFPPPCRPPRDPTFYRERPHHGRPLRGQFATQQDNSFFAVPCLLVSPSSPSSPPSPSPLFSPTLPP